MASGYSQEWSKTGQFTGKFRIWYSTSFNAETNTSTVTIRPQFLCSANYGNDYRIYSYGVSGAGVYVNGSCVYAFGSSFSAGNYLSCGTATRSWANLNYTKSFEIVHDGSGNASFTVGILGSVRAMHDGTVVSPIGAAASSRITIHENAASTVLSSSESVATQGAYSLEMRPVASSNRHVASFTCGGALLFESDPFAASLRFSVPRSWFAAYPETDTLPVTVSVQTYGSDGSALGLPATAALTVTADADMRPAVSPGWVSLEPFNTGAVAAVAGYVKGYSRAEAAFDETLVDMSAAVGAAIVSFSVTCQGETDQTALHLTPVLASTAVPVVCTVTDSRGRSASESFTLSVMDYAKPTLTGITISRCTDQGVADEDGDHYSAKATLTYSSLGGQNSAAMSCDAAAAGGSYGPEESMTSAAAHISAAQLSADASYTVRITATDALGNSAVFFQVLPTRKWAMKFRPDGNGVAFGKAAEHSGVFEVTEDWSVRFGSPLPIASGGTGADNAADARANLGIVSGGVTPVTEGGTGADNAVDARCNLGLGSVATEDVLPIAKGGTGGNTVADALANLGFESGTAANGSYCKLPDGTLLQWTKLSISAGAGATGNAVWTFPVPFAGTDYAVTTTAAVGTQANTRSRTMASGYNTTGITVYWRNESSSSYTMNVACLAVGRWK